MNASHRKRQDKQGPAEHLWHAPVTLADVPETGQHVSLVADAQIRAALAARAGLRELPHLTAEFDVSHHGQQGLRVVGRVAATVGQNCVVTLDPIDGEIDEPVDVVFLPAGATPAGSVELNPAAEDDGPETLVDGTADLGRLATEFLMLSIDPYPRKPDAVFEPPAAADDGSSHPFAALAALKDSKVSS